MKIKICGLQRIEDINYVNEANVDFAGFIFAKGSKRQITLSQAEILKTELKESIKSVGVFADDEETKIAEAGNKKIIDLIQLHGNEDNDYIDRIKSRVKLPVIKALKADKDLRRNIENTKADYVLIDSYTKDSFGGTGVQFNWELIPKTDKKIFLAGGININNAAEAIEKVNPYCLDINSGVETNGFKDRRKILEIISNIKGYQNEKK